MPPQIGQNGEGRRRERQRNVRTGGAEEVILKFKPNRSSRNNCTCWSPCGPRHMGKFKGEIQTSNFTTGNYDQQRPPPPFTLSLCRFPAASFTHIYFAPESFLSLSAQFYYNICIMATVPLLKATELLKKKKGSSPTFKGVFFFNWCTEEKHSSICVYFTYKTTHIYQHMQLQLLYWIIFPVNFPNELFIQTLSQSIWWSLCLHAPLHAIIKIRQRGEKVIDYLGYFLVLFASSEAKNNICNLKAISQQWIFSPSLIESKKKKQPATCISVL